MKLRYNYVKQLVRPQCWLFITGALLGACDRPSTHSAVPESSPVEAVTSPASVSPSHPHPVSTSSSRNGDTNSGRPAMSASSSEPALAVGPYPVSGESTIVGESTIKGCLSKPVAQQGDTRERNDKALHNEIKRSTRATSPTTNLRVTAMGNGALVTHEFSHACCLNATTETTLTDTTITVYERVAGTPCRCVCESAIQTRIKAPPGAYQVHVVMDINGARTTVGTQPLIIEKLTSL